MRGGKGERIREHRRAGKADESARELQNAVRGGGMPLDPAIRSMLEPRLGHRFDQVRVHAGDGADRMTQRVDAPAFTIGRDIAFSRGAYRPQSQSGLRLIAHELVHTIQQSGAQSAGAGVRVTPRHHPNESEADAAVEHMARGAVPAITTGNALAIARAPWDILDEVTGAVGGAVDSASDFAADVGGDIADVGSSAIEYAADVGSDVVDTVSDAGGEALDVAAGVGGVVYDMAANPGETMSGVYDVMKENAGYVKQGTDWVKQQIEASEDAPGWTDWVAEQAQGTMFEGAAGGLAWAGDQASSFSSGIEKGAVDMVGGIAGMAANPVDAAKGLFLLSEQVPGLGLASKALHSGYDLATGDTDAALSRFDTRNDAKFWGNLGSALIDPYKQAWNEEGGPDIAEMTGRAVFDVGSILLGGEGAAGKGGAGAVDDVVNIADDVSRAANVGDDVARTLNVVDDTSRVADEAARAMNMADEGARVVDDVARVPGGSMPSGGAPGGGSADWAKNVGHGPAVPEELIDDIMAGKNPPPPPGWEWKGGPPTGGGGGDWAKKVGHGPAVPEELIDDIMAGKNPPQPPGWDWQVGPPTGGPAPAVSPTAPTLPGTGMSPYAGPVSPTAPTIELPQVNPNANPGQVVIPSGQPGVMPSAKTVPVSTPYVDPHAPTLQVPGPGPHQGPPGVIPHADPYARTHGGHEVIVDPYAHPNSPTLPALGEHTPHVPTLPGIGPLGGGGGLLDDVLRWFS